MIKDRMVSISELKANPIKVINSIAETGDKYVFVQDEPKVVIVDINWFRAVSKKFNRHWIEYSEPDEYEKKAIEEYKKEKEGWKLETVEAFSFLNSLK